MGKGLGVGFFGHRRPSMTANRAPGARVQVDQDRCEGNRRCENAAPEVFEVREDDLSYVKLEVIPENLKDAVDRAIRLCPRQAISWVD